MDNDRNDANMTEVAVIGAATSVIAAGVAVLDILRYRNRTRIPDIPRAPHAHPTHDKYLNKKIEMYDEIALVVSKDRAKGNFAKSFGDVDLEARPEIEPIHLDDENAFEDISNDKNAGKQSACSSGTSSQPRAHRKRGRDTYDEESDIKTISDKLGQVADAITKLTWDRLDVQALHDEVMKMEGFDEAFLGSAFDYLVENERLGKAFMAKSINVTPYIFFS
ncbi:hypothetical protein Vadar_006771 [Vaccinium darrowii]|uniref:Uncharacterized protein n=1 Tax=Vaccinium darrowii TaxID=229202 RepID=A0ACB7XNQ4_9ERIC|nr:hypothetical protein Vadar_006771 [Vaccinium darrowii]